MLASYVLRLIAADAMAGRLVGEVQDVRTGTTRRFRDVGELVAVVQESQQAAATTPIPEVDPWHAAPAPASD